MWYCTCAYVDEQGGVSRAEVVQHGGVVEEGQVGHVLGLLELGRIHLQHQLLLQRHLQPHTHT